MAENAGNPRFADNAWVWSVGSDPTSHAPARANAHGMISRSRVVENTIGSWMSVRGVATWVSLRTSTVCGWGADSQNVTLPWAGAGERSSTPMSSRNLM